MKTQSNKTMKAIIENAPEFLLDDEKNTNMLNGFNCILEEIVSATDEPDLRKRMKFRIGTFRYFKWGFGAHHMWVHQNDVNDYVTIDETKRILIVEF